MHPIEQRRGLPQFGGRGESVTCADTLVPGVVISAHLVRGVGGGELVEHLPEGSHPGKEITEHSVGVGGVLKRTGRMCEAAERFGRFRGVGGRVLEGRHDGLLLALRRCGTAATLRP